MTDCYVLVEPFAPEKLEPVPIEDVSMFFGDSGQLAQKLEGFEKRDAQIEMAKLVAAAFNEEKILTVEAGTGTGKSLAYLVPAIMWAKKNNQKVVISTNTINLQEQLIKKDIPFLQNNSSLEFKAELIKGKHNYLCKRKLFETISMHQQELFDESERLKGESHIVEWAARTKEGSLSELNFVPPDDVWEKFCAENDICLKVRCPYYNECFYYQARRRANTADIIVANHHLLFADLSVKQDMPDTMGAILPPFKHIILDEAHNIEDIAAAYFGFSFSKSGLIKLLGRLQHSKYRGRGVLPETVMKLMSIGKTSTEQVTIQKLIDHINNDLMPYRSKVLVTTNSFFEELEDSIKSLASHYGKTKGENTLRINEDIQASPEWKTTVKPVIEALKKELTTFNKKIKEVAKLLELFDTPTKKEIEFNIITIKALIRRNDEYIKKLAFLIEPESDNVVMWFEWTRKSGALSYKVIPLDVAPLLVESLYSVHKTVILTSATLTIEQKFDFIEERVGLNLLPAERKSTALLQSPFNYDEQVLLAIPFDMPEPVSPKFDGALSNAIFDLVSLTDGKAFILFTSYYLLTKIFEELEPQLEGRCITPLKQGDMNRHHLLEQFKLDVHSCLFATDSFWEGVDVVGESLSSVIITKLPFKVPTDPVQEARAELLKSRGKDPFSDYAIPLAILKFRQGIGRLIRHKTDRGIITILDSRIITKFYGKKFIRSLFVSKPVIDSRLNIYEKIKTFLGSSPST
ncbi:MAG: helicase [Candidatus Margulisiibacteriota bacterium]|nr:MAG: helicase [Candidatus Margulisiibacteriota bacterium]